MLREYLHSLATDKSEGFIASIIKAFLLLLSIIYAAVVRIFSFLCRIRPYQLNCKVISVGNITLGGTGKTSLVELLARLLKDKGKRIAILSRGYARPKAGVAGDKLDYQRLGDEAYMLQRNLVDVPVIVDQNRIRSGRRAIQDYQADSVILDDGFQQWRIKKDLEIVAVDATNPFGNLHILPRGILREPPASLKRADIFVLTKVNINPDNQKIKDLLNRINPDALIVESIHKPIGFYRLGSEPNDLIKAEEFLGKKVSLVCGIADPQSFEHLINSLGIATGLVSSFPDHYNYSFKDLDKIIRDSRQRDINIIITTQKDSVRLPTMDYRTLQVSCFVLRIRLEILQNEIFTERIRSLYQP